MSTTEITTSDLLDQLNQQLAEITKERDGLRVEREGLIGVLQLTEKMFNYILELSRIDRVHTQAQQGIRAINDALNQQRSTSE